MRMCVMEELSATEGKYNHSFHSCMYNRTFNALSLRVFVCSLQHSFDLSHLVQYVHRIHDTVECLLCILYMRQRDSTEALGQNIMFDSVLINACFISS